MPSWFDAEGIIVVKPSHRFKVTLTICLSVPEGLSPTLLKSCKEMDVIPTEHRGQAIPCQTQLVSSWVLTQPVRFLILCFLSFFFLMEYAFTQALQRWPTRETDWKKAGLANLEKQDYWSPLGTQNLKQSWRLLSREVLAESIEKIGCTMLLCMSAHWEIHFKSLEKCFYHNLAFLNMGSYPGVKHQSGKLCPSTGSGTGSPFFLHHTH